MIKPGERTITVKVETDGTGGVRALSFKDGERGAVVTDLTSGFNPDQANGYMVMCEAYDDPVEYEGHDGAARDLAVGHALLIALGFDPKEWS